MKPGIKYSIKRWDPIIFPGNVEPFPVIYIKPDKKFIDFAKRNNYNIFVRIENTGKIYDGKAMVGIVDSAANVPNYRPNFYNDTEYYVIILYAQWRGYPFPKMGDAYVMGLKGEGSLLPVEVPPFKPPSPIQEPYVKTNSNETSNCSSLSSSQLSLILVGILVVFSVLIVISYKK